MPLLASPSTLGFSALTRLPRSAVHTALGQAAETVCGARTNTQTSGPHKRSRRPHSLGAAQPGELVECPCLSAPAVTSATLWTSQTLLAGREHTQAKDYLCCRISTPLKIGKALLGRKIQTKHSACSQDGITGTRLRFPPKTTK